MTPKIVSPKEWGALVDYDQWNDPFTPDDGIALHHGGGGDYAAHNPPYTMSKETAQLRAWERYHILGRGWRGIAYGYAFGQTGNIYRLRGFNRYGAHTGDVDGDGIANNDEIVPFLFIGSGSVVRLSVDAQNSIAWARKNIVEVRSPAAKYLWGHQEISPTGTTCPGRYGMEYVRANRFLKEEPDMEKIPRPSWFSDEVLARLAEQNIVPRAEETEDMWRMLAFIDRHDTKRPHEGAVTGLQRGDTVKLT